MSAVRLSEGGRIDRSKKLAFSWDGKTMQGFHGDTLASALLANDELLIARSFKYHRPRGVMSAGVEESGALVTIGSGNRRDPNVKATQQELYDGLEAFAQNAWPNVKTDMGSVNNLLGRFFSAGFYYKTFMGLPPLEWGKGTGLWMQYEKIIRKAAGLGTASREPDPDAYDHANAFCDVLVVGGGPAGLAAAASAAKAGLDVILVEQDGELGGDLLSKPSGNADNQRDELIDAVNASGVNVMLRTSAFGLYDYGTAGLLERVTDHQPVGAMPHQPRQRFWTVRARRTILATGSFERTIAFGNNDRPGILSASAARTYLNRFGVRTGENVIVATNNDSAYNAAFDLHTAGAEVTVLDARSEVTGDLTKQIADSGVDVRFKTVPLNVSGSKRISSLTVANGSPGAWQKGETIETDNLLLSGGWSPVVNLISHRGVKPVWHAETACFVAPANDEPVSMIGSAAGIWQTDACIESGNEVGRQLADSLAQLTGTVHRAEHRLPATEDSPPSSGSGWENPILPVYEITVPGEKTKAFVDPQHDVTTDDIRLAHQEGFVSVEHLKRYTTLGMATDGGKVGNVIGLALMAEALGKEIPEVGTTTFRPPYTPVSIGALRGRNVDEHFRCLRRTAMHDWNLKYGATMTMAGLWHRPWFFAREGETITEAYIREATTVRETVGLCDVTSLGKIAIQGPDATELLNRVYTNPFAKLPIGKARYGIMLRDDGIVMDDGTTWRLSETEYFMTTTTAHAAKVMVFLEELLQTRWTDLKVHVTSVSEQWAGCAVAGPKSRETLQACMENPDELRDENFPFMGVRDIQFKGGIPARIARISFSGERAFEAYVPSDYAEAMMDMLWVAAQGFDGCLYGLESLGALRIEKGHVTGAELDGRVTIDDAGLGKMAATNKSYIGSTLKNRPELQREDRPQLVGIFPKNREETFNSGAILCNEDAVEGLGEGWITAVTYSPALGHWIGLGFLKGGYANKTGQTLIAADPVRKGNIEVEVVSPHMYDPKGERMYG